jgi:hypothetical protein
MNKTNAAVIGVARKTRNVNEIVLLSTGYFAKLRAVSAGLIAEAQQSIKFPEAPKWFNEAAGREEENPSHPAYLAQIQEVEMQRNLAGSEAMIMFGVELVNEDGSPYEIDPEGAWVKRLRFMEKRHMASLEGLDLDDEVDLEFAFKKYIAVGAPDMETIASATIVNEEALASAKDSFRGN